MRRALITGGCGFVGRRFVCALLDRGFTVDVVDDLSSGVQAEDWPDQVRLANDSHVEFMYADLREFIGNVDASDYDLIIHLAAVVGGRLTIEGDPLHVATDLAIDADFFNWITRGSLPGRVVYFSSSAAYPIALQTRDNAVPLSEDLVDFDQGALGVPDMTYGWAKLTGEYLAQHAARTYGLDVVCYRPFSGYGEEQSLTYPFPSILQRVHRREDPLIVWGTGEQTRDFIHIDDVVGAVLASMEVLDRGATLNLGLGRGITMSELAIRAAAVAGYAPQILCDTSKPEGVFSRVADNSRMLSHYAPKVELNEGIRRVLFAANWEGADQ